MDDNNNAQADDPESKISMNLALVGITINTFAPVVHPALLAFRNPTAGCPDTTCVAITTGGTTAAGAADGFNFANTAHAAFYVSSTVTLTGGGADGKLGVDKITVFFMQNFKNDTFTGTYRGSALDILCLFCRTVKEVFVCDTATGSPICAGNPVLVPFPTIDKGYAPAYPNGGITPSSAGNYQTSNIGGDITTRKLEWLDSPDFVDTVTHPCDNTKTLISTSGANAFAVYMLSFGDHTTHTYVANAAVDWTATVSGDVASATDLMGVAHYAWAANGSAGVTQAGQAAGYPKNANGASIMVYGPDSVFPGGSALKDDARN